MASFLLLGMAAPRALFTDPLVRGSILGKFVAQELLNKLIYILSIYMARIYTYNRLYYNMVFS